MPHILLEKLGLKDAGIIVLGRVPPVPEPVLPNLLIPIVFGDAASAAQELAQLLVTAIR